MKPQHHTSVRGDHLPLAETSRIAPSRWSLHSTPCLSWLGVFAACSFIPFSGWAEKSESGNRTDLTSESITLADGVSLDEGIVHLRRSANAAATVPLFSIESPAVTRSSYVIRGQVKCRLDGNGYLEMWSHLPLEKGGTEAGPPFFSRTLAEVGPLRRLRGEQDWRTFELPAIVNDGSGRRPLLLEINASLPAEAELSLKELELIQPYPGAVAFDRRKSRRVLVTAGVAIVSAVVGGVVVWGCFALRRHRRNTELERIRRIDSPDSGIA